MEINNVVVKDGKLISLSVNNAGSGWDETKEAWRYRSKFFNFHRFLRDNNFREIAHRNQWHSSNENYPNVYSEEEVFELFEKRK